MKQEITRALGDGAIAIAVSGGIANDQGWFEFINTNASGLGFIASCFFGILGTMFYWLTFRKKTANSEKIAKLEAEIERINDRKLN